MNEQGTEEWFADRLGKVTASKIADVMMKPTTAGYQNYRAQLVCERLTGQPTETFTSADMQHGTDTEPQARAFYEMETGLDVEQVGFIPHPTLGMTGASPDGEVGTDGLVEIKCPKPATHIKTLTGVKIARNYMLQMTWQMICTGRAWCDFVSFCPSLPAEMQMFRQRVEMDAELAVEITSAVTSFLSDVDALTLDLQAKYQRDAAA
ncbi:MAG: YqaJ viral recombinase family protein [Rhodobacteraceae bacterium]|nr:YqaJ viral recombinase family protein [Paracoccaceae bacterium]